MRLLDDCLMLSDKSFDEAKLIFDDDNSLINQLHIMYNKFYQLSKKEIKLVLEFKIKIPKARVPCS